MQRKLDNKPSSVAWRGVVWHAAAAAAAGQSYLDPNNGGIELKVTLCIGYIA